MCVNVDISIVSTILWKYSNEEKKSFKRNTCMCMMFIKYLWKERLLKFSPELNHEP